MENYVDKLIALSKDKKELLNSILDFTKKQKLVIEKEDLDSIASILEDKEKIIKKIDLIDLEFLKYYDLLKKSEGIDSFDGINIKKYDNVRTLKGLVKDINSILNEISILDKNNTKLMKASIENIKSDIKSVKKGKQAYNGYNYEIGGSMLIDEKK